MRVFVIVSLSVFFLLLLPYKTVYACRCLKGGDPLPLEKAFAASEAVFFGKVISLSVDSEKSSVLNAKFVVSQRWKGEAMLETEIKIVTCRGKTVDEKRYAPGTEHVIFTDRTVGFDVERSTTSIDWCSRSHNRDKIPKNKLFAELDLVKKEAGRSIHLKYFMGGSLFGDTHEIEIFRIGAALYRNSQHAGKKEKSKITKRLSKGDLNRIYKLVTDEELLKVNSQDYKKQPLRPDQARYDIKLQVGKQVNAFSCGVPVKYKASLNTCQVKSRKLGNLLTEILGIKLQ